MDKNTSRNTAEDRRANQEQKGVDKAPGEEKGHGELVTNNDLKGKKVDGDPSKEEDKPLAR